MIVVLAERFHKQQLQISGRNSLLRFFGAAEVELLCLAVTAVSHTGNAGGCRCGRLRRWCRRGGVGR